MTVKTTISLPEELFEKMQREADEAGTPRSRFVAEAVAEKLKRIENDRLTALYSEAYADDDNPEDKAMLEGMRRYSIEAIQDDE